MKNETNHIVVKLIKKYNLTPEQIAVKMGMSYPAVITWMNGTKQTNGPTLEKLNRILRGYESRG